MREHTRVYQYMFSKTNSMAIATAGTVAAKATAMAAVGLKDLFGEKRVPVVLETAEGWLQEICPYDQNSVLPSIPCCRESGNATDISVIIPIHNGEKYVEDCLKSIFSQEENCSLQVIAVNDRSTDATWKILQELKKKYPIEIYETKNGGTAGRARNEGLLHATGEYVMFIDCDDVLPKGAIDALYEEALYTHADIVQGSWKYLQNDNNGQIQFFWPHKLTHPKNDADMMQISGVPWGKIYKRELFDRVGFSENLPCYEDAVIHGIVFERATVIRTIVDVVYEWRQTPDGLTASTQGTDRGVNAYWTTKELVETRKKLDFQATDFWYRNLVLQLSCYCYPCVRNMTDDSKKKVFDACRALYLEESGSSVPHPQFLRKQTEYWAAKALETGNYALWKTVGKLYPILM